MKNTIFPRSSGFTFSVVLLLTVFLGSSAFAAPRRGSQQAIQRSSGYTAPRQQQPVQQPVRRAQQPVQSIEQVEYVEPDAPWIENDWYLFAGFDLGMSSYGKNELVASDASRSGLHLGFRLLLAHYWENWVADAGLGWSFIKNSGTNNVSSTYKVTTRTGYIDLSPRYRLSQNWQIGPEFEYYLGSDSGLNPDIFSGTSNSGNFLGLQAIYEWQGSQVGDNKYRFGGRWLTGLNIENRSASIFQVFFQVGFSMFGDAEPREDAYVPVRSAYQEGISDADLYNAEPYEIPADPLPIATPAPAPVAEAPIAQEKMTLTLDVNALPFEFDSARLPTYNKDRVREIGRFLGENRSSWKYLIISGHTDERGSNQYNAKLSKARADTVRQLLIEGGVPRTQVRSVGYGEDRPKDRRHNEEAWAKNRRVELEFRGVKNMVIIRDALSR